MKYFNVRSGKTLFAEWVPMEKVVINHEFNDEKWTHDYIRIASFRNPIEKKNRRSYTVRPRRSRSGRGKWFFFPPRSFCWRSVLRGRLFQADRKVLKRGA